METMHHLPVSCFTCNLSHLDNSTICIYDSSIIHNNKTYESKGRYGFRKDELIEITNSDIIHMLMCKNKTSRIFSDEEFKSLNIKTFNIGLCGGRPLDSSIGYLNKYGFCPIKPKNNRCLQYTSNDYIKIGDDLYHVNYIVVKATDIIKMMNIKFIDAVVCYSDIWYNLDKPNYNIKKVFDDIDVIGNNYGEKTCIALVSKNDFVLDKKILKLRRNIKMAKD